VLTCAGASKLHVIIFQFDKYAHTDLNSMHLIMVANQELANYTNDHVQGRQNDAKKKTKLIITTWMTGAPLHWTVISDR
jgi:uncharacterized protein YvpB